jgi:hypothetical protein
MAHCPFAQLDDLTDCFDELRSWPDVREARPGVFYVKRVPFLHFHIDQHGRRWADIRAGADWGPEVDLPRGASPALKQRFLREARRRYAATAGATRQSR